MTSTDQKPLKGWRVLVPRGGPWGDASRTTSARRAPRPSSRP